MIENNNEENDIEEEILGSVTHHGNDKTLPTPLRTSARVSKKLRLDSQNASNQEKSQDKKDKIVEVKNSDQKSGTTKRINGLWSSEDKNVFFKALNEYGKDYVSIETYMNNKRKKRGISRNVSKNKDQARHFYYRTWNKISKYVKFPPDVNKVTQELYALINFGEFRKKMGFFSEKYAIKLNELIYLGATQIRVRGRTIRIKTPVCRALRKLNQMEECFDDTQLPTRILVELRPRDNLTWSRIQALSMNPRVRTTLPLHSQLISLLEYLQHKWQPLEMKTKPKVPPVPSGSDKMPSLLDEDISLLRVAPKEGVNIIAPVISTKEFVNSSHISFLSYEKKISGKSTNFEEVLKQINLNIPRNGKSQKLIKKQTLDEDKIKSSAPDNNESDGLHSETDMPPPTFQQLPQKDTPKETAAVFLETAAVKQVSDEIEDNNANVVVEKEDEDVDNHRSSPEISNLQRNEIISKAKAGWTIKNAETLRIGDLYLMFGTDSKLQLEYWWEDSSIYGTDTISSMLQKLISVAQTVFAEDKKVYCRNGSKDCKKKRIHSVKMKPGICNNSVPDQQNPGTVQEGDVRLQEPSFVQQDQREAGVGSFQEQLSKLQPRYLGRQRRPGHRQKSVLSRMLPTFSNQNIYQSHQDPATYNDGNNSYVPTVNEQNRTAVEKSNNRQNGDENCAIRDILDANVSSSNINHKEQVSTAVGDTFLDHDDDTRFSRLSNASSLTRFIERTLANLKSANKDGLTSPTITSENINELLGELNQSSPHFSSLELSNSSFNSLLAELDHAANQLRGSASTEDSISFSDTADNTMYLGLTRRLFNTNITSAE